MLLGCEQGSDGGVRVVNLLGSRLLQTGRRVLVGGVTLMCRLSGVSREGAREGLAPEVARDRDGMSSAVERVGDLHVRKAGHCFRSQVGPGRRERCVSCKAGGQL